MVYRRQEEGLEFLLAHPGGPLWRTRNAGAWSIPKGLVGPDEDLLVAALREFTEETGLQIPAPLIALASIRQAAGKIVHCWAAEVDLDLAEFQSNKFEMEWPPRSGRWASFPEVDQLRYVSTSQALKCVLRSQIPLIEEVLARAVGRLGVC